MALLPSVRLFLKFDNSNLLLNSVTNDTVVVKGDNTAATFLANGMGYIMQQDQYLIAENVVFNIRNDLTLGFWLYPTYPGVVADEDDNSISPLKISLLNIANTDPSMREDDESNMLILYEETQENGNNRLVIVFEDVSTGNYIARTEEYTPTIWHHFLFVYNGALETFNVLIDGKQTTLTEDGLLPVFLDMQISDFKINKKVVSGDNDVANNQGYIDDVFVLNSSDVSIVNSEEFVLKIIGNSSEYALDFDNEFIEDADTGFFIDQDPTTINITSMTRDTSRFFIGRTDGSILEGSALLWQTRRDFSNPDEQDVLNKNIFGDKIEIQNGILKIENSVVKI
jgi:hypothetical protein